MAATVQLFAFRGGTLYTAAKDMIEGGQDEVTMPVLYYLIVHSRWKMVFDTGMHKRCRHPRGRPKFLRKRFRLEYSPDEDIVSRLQAVGLRTKDIHYVANSHLHFDHAGGNTEFPHATLIAGESELAIVRDPEKAEKYGYDSRDVNCFRRRFSVPRKGEYDLSFDGSAVLFDTPGHTHGHVSLKLRLEQGVVVLAGDACYFCNTLLQRAPPKHCSDRDQFLRSLDTIDAYRAAGAVVIPGHDERVTQLLPMSHGKLCPVTNLDELRW